MFAFKKYKRKNRLAVTAAALFALCAFTCADPESNAASMDANRLGYTLTVGMNNGERGEVTYHGTTEHGLDAVVRNVCATPADGYVFTAWTDGNGETFGDSTITSAEICIDVRLRSDISIVANFERRVNLTVRHTPEDGGGARTRELPEGAVVDVCPVPAAHWRFVGWTEGSTETCPTIEIWEDMEFTARVERLRYLTVDIMGGGTVWISPCLQLGGGGPIMDEDEEEEGIYHHRHDEHGHPMYHPVYCAEYAGEYDEWRRRYNTQNPRDTLVDGARLRLCAEADPGYRFDGWDGAVESGEPCVEVTMDADLKFYVNLGRPILRITRDPAIGGGVTIGGTSYSASSPNPTTASQDINSTVEMCAVPADGYRFVRWEIEGTTAHSSALCQPITMDGNRNVTARFERLTLTVIRNPAIGGSVCVGTACRPPSVTSTPVMDTVVSNHNHGDVVRVCATPDTVSATVGYRFVRWDIAGTSWVPSRTERCQDVTMTDSWVMTARFERLRVLRVIISPSGGGRVIVHDERTGAEHQYTGPRMYPNGASLWLRAEPIGGRRFVRWLEGGDVLDEYEELHVEMYEDRTLTAEFW